MTSEIILELQKNVGAMEKLISNQKFTVGDAEKFLTRYFNVLRKMEQLVESRDLWKEKYKKLLAKKSMIGGKI